MFPMSNSKIRGEKTKRALVFGADGFIGHHLAKKLKREKFWIKELTVKKKCEVINV